MLISIHTQLNVLIYSILAGMLIGVLFDLYRLLRGVGNPNTIITFFEDILFWLFTSIIIFIFLLYTNYALVKVYVFLYIAFGMFCYFKLMSKYFISVQYKMIKHLGKAIRIFLNLLKYPFQLIIYRFRRKIKINTKK